MQEKYLEKRHEDSLHNLIFATKMEKRCKKTYHPFHGMEENEQISRYFLKNDKNVTKKVEKMKKLVYNVFD